MKTSNYHQLSSVMSRTLPLVLLSVLAGCSGAGTDASKVPEAKRSDTPELFSIPQEQMSHVQVLTVQPSTLTRTLRLTGTVAYNSFQTTPVIAQVSGPISRMVVVPGQRVRRGEPMLYVASPDFSQLRTNYLKARDASALAHKTYVRAQDLYQHHAIAVKDLEQAESAEVQAAGDLASAEAALKVMGVSDPDALVKAPPSFEVPVLAPIAGEVVEQDVSAGQLLQPGSTQCFMISDTSTVWVLVNVYQKDLPYVRTGDAVTIQTDAYPDVFQGRISYVAASLDPTTRTLQARIQTNNPGEKLKKDMYVTASVQAGTHQGCDRGAGCSGSARRREPAIRLRRAVSESVRNASGHSRRKPERTDSNYQRPETRRACYRRRQPVSCSLRTRCSAELETWPQPSHNPNDPSNRPSRASPAIPGADAHRLHHHWRHHLVPAHAGGRLSRPRPSPGRNHHPVAGPRRRGSRAAGHASARARDERRAAHGGDAVHLALRAFRRHPDIRRGYRQLFRPPDCLRAPGRRHRSRRSDAGFGAAVQPQRSGLPLRAAKSRPHPAGFEDH